MYRALKKPPFKEVVLTERDDLILRTVERYRLVTTDQLARVTGAQSRRAINSRLYKLWGADLLARPEIQRQINSFGSERPLIHALGQRGALRLSRKYQISYPKGKGWNTANELKSINFVDHRLGTTDTMLAFEAGIAGNEQFRFIDHHELRLYAPKGTENLRYPQTLPTQLPDKRGVKRRKGTKPDYSFAIENKELPKQANKALLFLEWDNNTEDYVRGDPMQSSIAGKYLGYGDAYKRGLHTKIFGFKNFRVLFVVNAGSDRVEKMILTYQKFAKDLIPAGAFLHTTVAELALYGPYAPIWVNGRGEQTEVL